MPLSYLLSFITFVLWIVSLFHMVWYSALHHGSCLPPWALWNITVTVRCGTIISKQTTGWREFNICKGFFSGFPSLEEKAKSTGSYIHGVWALLLLTSSISGSLIKHLPQGCSTSLMEAVHVQFNCWEHCKFISHTVKFSCSVFATEPVTDNFSVGCEHELVWELCHVKPHQSFYKWSSKTIINGQSFYVEITSCWISYTDAVVNSLLN